MNHDLLLKYLLAEATEAELQRVTGWLASSEANQKEFDQFAWLWQQSKRLAASSTVNEAEAWDRFVQFRNNAYSPKVVSLPSRNRFTWMRVAAAFLAIVALSVAGVLYLTPASVPEQIQFVSTSAPVTDTLPDGTIVTLNKNSSLTHPEKFSANKRLVKMQGEAFFTVTPNEEKPFIIEVQDVLVTVVGTSFNIKEKPAYTEIIVETGIVEVTHHDETIRVKAGQKIQISKTDDKLSVAESKEQLHQYYRTNVFVCDNTRLSDLVATLNEAYNVQIIIANTKLADIPITTTFNNESLETILNIVSQTLDISWKQQGDLLILQ